MTAGHTNGTVQLAKPTEIADIDLEKAVLGGELAERAARVDEGGETNADVDRTATLGEDPATMACRVDEGDGTEHGYQAQLQQTILYCKEDQRSGNANANVPSTYGVPLKGEWAVCASSKSGCKSGTSVRASIDETDGDPGQGVEPTGIPIKSETLVIVSIQSEDPRSSGIPRVHLRGTTWHAGDTNGIGDRVDTSKGQTDESKGPADGSSGWTDTLTVSDSAGSARISHSDDPDTYLGPGDAKRIIHKADGVGSQTDASTEHSDVPSVETDSDIPANETGIVSTC